MVGYADVNWVEAVIVCIGADSCISNNCVSNITIGDGVNSWGDLNGTDAYLITLACGLLPANGGTIFLKRGTYINTGTLAWSDGINATLEGEEGTVIENRSGSYWYIDSMSGVTIKNVEIKDGDGSSTIGMYLDCNPSYFFMENVIFTNCRFTYDSTFPTRTSFDKCGFYAATSAMASLPLIQVASAGSHVLHGVFNDCEFYHLSSDGTGKHLIDLTNSTATNPANGVTFNNCAFFSLNSGLFTYSMNFGTGPHNVTFDTCEFGAGAALASIFYDEGTDLKIINCDNTTAWGLVVAHNSSPVITLNSSAPV